MGSCVDALGRELTRALSHQINRRQINRRQIRTRQIHTRQIRTRQIRTRQHRRRRRVLRAGSAGVVAIGLIGWALISSGTQLGQPRTATGAYWGVDSVATTPARLASVQRDYVATPAFWGRYLSDCTNRCGGNLTSAEAHQDIAGGIRLLLVAADAGGRADRGRAHGVADGRRAVAAARALGVPRGVALFKDLENDSPVNASFIAAWYGAVSAGGYEPGFYLNALPGEDGGAAYCLAVRADPAVGSSYLWASESERGAWASTPPGRAPAFSGARFQAVFPACRGRDAVWQYSESDNGGVDEDESLTVAPLWI